MEKAVEGPILNSMEFGGEIIYRFYPRIRPGIDSRIDSFGDRYFTDWQNMYKDEVALNRLIARHDIRFMLLMPHDFATVREMPTIKTGWKMMWSDHKSVLIRR